MPRNKYPQLWDRRPGNDRDHRFAAPHQQRFRITTGSDQARAAFQALIRKIKLYDTRDRIRYVDPISGAVSTCNLVQVANAQNLAETGLMFIPPSQDSDLPLVKTIPVESMIKSYSTELAAQKERELLEKGSSAALRSVKQRLKLEKKRLATKQLLMTWKISMGDLKNQKGDEIQRRIARNEKFVIDIRNKQRRSIETEVVENEEEDTESDNAKYTNIRYSRAFEDEQDLNIELKRREMVRDGVIEILENLPCTFEVNGDIALRVFISVVPNVPEPVSGKKEIAKETVSEKELRRQRRAQLKKQPKTLSKETQDLDLLYALSIED